MIKIEVILTKKINKILLNFSFFEETLFYGGNSSLYNARHPFHKFFKYLLYWKYSISFLKCSINELLRLDIIFRLSDPIHPATTRWDCGQGLEGERESKVLYRMFKVWTVVFAKDEQDYHKVRIYFKIITTF